MPPGSGNSPLELISRGCAFSAAARSRSAGVSSATQEGDARVAATEVDVALVPASPHDQNRQLHDDVHGACEHTPGNFIQPTCIGMRRPLQAHHSGTQSLAIVRGGRTLLDHKGALRRREALHQARGGVRHGPGVAVPSQHGAAYS